MQKNTTMKLYNSIALVAAGLAVLPGCTLLNSSATENKPDQKGVLLVYSEKEPGGPTYTSRAYIDSNYLYFKDERNPEDFVLFKRKDKVIYSVNHSDKTILVIKNRPVSVPSPIPIDYVEESQPSAAIPKVDNRQATHFRYSANGVHCYDAVALQKDFLPDVVQALKEYRLVLAGEHAFTLPRMPAETHDACDLALNIFDAAKHLEHGLPIREWDQQGFLRFMTDYRVDYHMEPERFKLPDGYREYSVD